MIAPGFKALARAAALIIGLGSGPLAGAETVSPFGALYDRNALYAPGSEGFEALRTDDAMIAFIKERETLQLEAFRGPSGLWLIGYGHAATARPGLRLTEAEAERLLDSDLRRFEAAVKARLTRPVRRRELSAMVDLAYNAGVGAFNSSAVLRRFNQGDRSGAADAFLLWNKYRVRGRLRRSAELTRRRAFNRAYFLGEQTRRE